MLPVLRGGWLVTGSTLAVSLVTFSCGWLGANVLRATLRWWQARRIGAVIPPEGQRDEAEPGGARYAGSPAFLYGWRASNATQRTMLGGYLLQALETVRADRRIGWDGVTRETGLRMRDLDALLGGTLSTSKIENLQRWLRDRG